VPQRCWHAAGGFADCPAAEDRACWRAAAAAAACRAPREGWAGSVVRRKKESSFLKKRTKNLLDIGVRLPDRRATAIQESFASFLQKRSSFL
jgi:hypothetical protein